ncbi:MAG: IS110 family transposase [Bacilli bacterium]|nr:IS110 family transposase [Bacilli bacterium]
MEHILSFDIAKGKSVYCFINEKKNIIIEPTSINHNKNEFDNLFNIVHKYNNLTVVMESTSVYHLPVENYFRSKGIDTIVMNPKLVKQYKDTLNKSKTDKIDCFKIARCYLGTIDNLYQKNDQYFMFNPLARQYWSLIEGQTRLKNRYKQLIEIVFPEFNLIFNDLYSDLALSFIHDFPHPALFVNRRTDYLMNYLKQKNSTKRPYGLKNKVSKMKEIASNSLCYVGFDSLQVQNLVQTIEMIQYHKQEINKLKEQLISSLKDTNQFKIINSIPGFGDFSTALFLAEVGDITRFDNKYQFISFIGIDSVTSQSGKSEHHGPISKTGCKFARTLLFNTVTSIIQVSAHFNIENPIYLFFRKKQSEGKHHYKCIIACETKLCKIIYKLCVSDCLYKNK